MAMRKAYDRVALDQKVLAVAVVNIVVETGEVFDWSAYIGAVPGQCHREEFVAVANEGSKLSKEMAELLFKMWPISEYRN